MGLKSTLKRMTTPLPNELTHLVSDAVRDGQSAAIPRYYNILIDEQHARLRHDHPNPLARYGMKCFSQSDEDGITIEIVKRLGIASGTFAEFGVGDGTENNTLILCAMGWKGFWVGGEDLSFDVKKSNRLQFHKTWVTLDNICSVARSAMEHGQHHTLDVVSLDLDGNDLFFVEALLKSGVMPSLFIVEYNAKFPPPVRFSINYESTHKWIGDDYFGASLSSFADLFESFGYRLICCNAATGVNAFFIKDCHSAHFPEVPQDISMIFTPPNYHHHTNYGHPTSARTIEALIA